MVQEYGLLWRYHQIGDYGFTFQNVKLNRNILRFGNHLTLEFAANFDKMNQKAIYLGFRIS